MGLRRCGGRRPAGASRAGSPPGVMGSVSWPGRGARATSVASRACCPVMRPGRPWWGRRVLQGVVEAVDPSPRGLGDGVGQGLPARVAEQGLAEALVVARGWWARRGFGGGGFDAGERTCPGRAAGDWAPAGARGRAVVGRAGAGARPGRLRPCRRRRWPPDRPSPGATSQATARRQWSSWSRPGHRPCARRPGRTRRRPGPPAGVGGGAGRTCATPPAVSWTARPRPTPSRPVDPWTGHAGEGASRPMAVILAGAR